jgi:hypothetical protein
MYIKFNMFFLYPRKVPVGAHEMGIESTKSLMPFVQVAVWQVNKCSRNLCTPQFLSVSWLADSKIPCKNISISNRERFARKENGCFYKSCPIACSFKVIISKLSVGPSEW